MRYGLLLGMALSVLLSIPAMGVTVADSPDSIIIGNASVSPGQTQVTVPVYFVTSGDVTFYNLPLRVEAAGDIKFQGHQTSAALQPWDDSWQGLGSDGVTANHMGFADLGGDDNSGFNTARRRVEAFDLIFSVDKAIKTRRAEIIAKVDERTGGPLFGYSDGIKSVAPVVVGGSIVLAAGPATFEPLPTEIALNQNYPNPFNPSTEIEFALPGESFVNLSIFNILGQEVKSLVSETKQAGIYKVTWDGTNNEDQAVPSGTYFYRMDAGDFSQAMKMALLK